MRNYRKKQATEIACFFKIVVLELPYLKNVCILLTNNLRRGERIMSQSSLYAKRLEEEGRNLSKFIATDWNDYDFSEKTEELERRVPKIYFNNASNIEVRERRPELVKGFGYEKYIRRYEITHRDLRFLLVVTVDSYWNCVKKFWLTMFGLVEPHDGNKEPEQIKIFTESL